MTATRTACVTQKVKTPFGNLYAHVSHDDRGRVREIAFSHPGRFGNSAIGDALVALGEAATAIIADIAGRRP